MFVTPHQQDIEREGLQWSSPLELPVTSTFDGSDLRTVSDVTRELIQLITVKPVHWEKATAEKGMVMLSALMHSRHNTSML